MIVSFGMFFTALCFVLDIGLCIVRNALKRRRTNLFTYWLFLPLSSKIGATEGRHRGTETAAVEEACTAAAEGHTQLDPVEEVDHPRVVTS